MFGDLIQVFWVLDYKIITIIWEYNFLQFLSGPKLVLNLCNEKVKYIIGSWSNPVIVQKKEAEASYGASDVLFEHFKSCYNNFLQKMIASIGKLGVLSWVSSMRRGFKV